MNKNRELWFKLERLDSSEAVLEAVTGKLTGGRVEISATHENRRKISFDLLEPLPDSWQATRWKAYYGFRSNIAEPIQYFPQGVFIPMNPSENEIQDGYISNLQGADKMKLFYDYEIDTPVTFASGTTVRSIIQQVAGWFNEAKFKLEAELGTLGADLTFEEGTTAGSLLSTLVSSFNAEAFYDVDGYLVARKITSANERPIRYVLDDPDDGVYVTSSRSIDEQSYYNRVTVVGGTVDTEIFRATRESAEAIARAGGRVVQRYFTVDAAVTQSQVDGRADYYLSQGISLPSQINITNLVIPDLEVGDVVEKAGKRYEAQSITVPLDLQLQSISAKEIL